MAGYGDFAYYYDALNVDAQYVKRAEYTASLLRERGCRSGLLLDLACGTGTITELLSKMGYEMIGVDASAEMLSRAREKAVESGEDILYLCQNMEELDLFGTIDGAICTLDGINHLTDEKDLKTVFSRVSLFLNEGGVFVFDVNTPFKHREILSNNTFVYDVDPLFCVWQNETDEKSLVTRITLDIFEESDEGDYVRTTETFSERAYPLEDLAKWLEEAELSVVGIFREFEAVPVTGTDQRAVFVCINRKKHYT